MFQLIVLLVVFQHVDCEQICRGKLDFVSREPCISYDLENCENPSIPPKCPILRVHYKRPCLRFHCENDGLQTTSTTHNFHAVHSTVTTEIHTSSNMLPSSTTTASHSTNIPQSKSEVNVKIAISNNSVYINGHYDSTTSFSIDPTLTTTSSVSTTSTTMSTTTTLLDLTFTSENSVLNTTIASQNKTIISAKSSIVYPGTDKESLNQGNK